MALGCGPSMPGERECAGRVGAGVGCSVVLPGRELGVASGLTCAMFWGFPGWMQGFCRKNFAGLAARAFPLSTPEASSLFSAVRVCPELEESVERELVC